MLILETLKILNNERRKSEHTILHKRPQLQVKFTTNSLIFRYFMPKMVLKQESRLNGVKTNIFNLDEVAKALRVPEEGIHIITYLNSNLIAIIKYMCAELGASKEKKSILKG